MVKRWEFDKLIADDMAEKPDGEYVRFEDYQALAARMDKIRELLKDDEVGEWKELMDLVNG